MSELPSSPQSGKKRKLEQACKEDEKQNESSERDDYREAIRLLSEGIINSNPAGESMIELFLEGSGICDHCWRKSKCTSDCTCEDCAEGQEAQEEEQAIVVD